MEARRTFQGGVTSSKPNWMVVAALLAALLLAAVSVYLAKGMSSVSAPAATHVVTSFQAPDALDRNAEILASTPPISGSVRTKAVSENNQFYAAKMAELRADRVANRPLQSQIDDLMAFVRSCEERWNIDIADIDRSLTDN